MQELNNELKGMIVATAGTQINFAEKSGISEWKITGMVRGSYVPSEEEIEILVKHLGEKVLKVL